MAIATRPKAVSVDRLSCSAYEVPTDQPESDGTLEWDSTTVVVVEVEGGGATGLGYTYGDLAVATLIQSNLARLVEGADALAPATAWASMQKEIRNAGQPGEDAMAVSAGDIGDCDLKGKLLGIALADAMPRFHTRAPVYGSGGFSSYSRERIGQQLGAWVDQGISHVKIKVGRD